LWAQASAAPIFVLNSLDATVSVIDPASQAEIKRLDIGKEPHHVYLSPDERSLLAPGGPDCMELSADRKTLMVTSRWARKLSVIDVATKTVVRQINVGRSPHGVWALDHVASR
jgi:YVTN family beta-propeller protein